MSLSFIVENYTNYKLTFERDTFFHGGWVAGPPACIEPGKKEKFSASKRNYALTGVNGCFSYRLEGASEPLYATFSFSNPFIGTISANGNFQKTAPSPHDFDVLYDSGGSETKRTDSESFHIAILTMPGRTVKWSLINR